MRALRAADRVRRFCFLIPASRRVQLHHLQAPAVEGQFPAGAAHAGELVRGGQEHSFDFFLVGATFCAGMLLFLPRHLPLLDSVPVSGSR
jgi:hypothetical protein